MKKIVALIGLALALALAFPPSARATTKGLSQIVTPDLQSEGDLSLSFQAQSMRIANPYELQSELGLTKWAAPRLRSFQTKNLSEVDLSRRNRISFRPGS